MVAQILRAVWEFTQNLYTVVLSFLRDLFGYLFNGLIAVLKAIFNPILILVALVFYFVYKLGILLVTLIKVLLAIGKLIYSFVMGIFKTLAGFVWMPFTPSHGSWSAPIGEVFAALEPYQLNKIAYLLLFAIWMLTGYGAIKILSARGGGDD